jgi:hypothetical protein
MSVKTSEATFVAIGNAYQGWGGDSKGSVAERSVFLQEFASRIDALLKKYTDINRGSLGDFYGSIMVYFSNSQFWSYRFSDEDHKAFMKLDHTFVKKVCDELQKRMADDKG